MERAGPGPRCCRSGLRLAPGGRAAAQGARGCSDFPGTSRLPGPGSAPQRWRVSGAGSGEEELALEPSGLSRGPAHVDCPGGDEGAAGGWAWGGGER